MPIARRSRFVRSVRVLAVLALSPCVREAMAQDAAPAPAAEVQHETEAETIGRCLRDLASDSVDLRQRATLVLGKYEHPAARRGLLQALSDPEATVRRSAVVGLTASGRVDTQTAAAILTMIGDPDIQVRRLASFHVRICYLMGRMHVGRETREALVAAFTDEDVTVRKNMIAAHGVLTGVLPTSVLEDLLQDPEREVRILALEAATNAFQGERLVQVTEPLITDPDATVRLRLAQHLGNTRMAAAEPLLERLMRDPDDGVSRAARLGLYHARPSRERFEALRPGIDAGQYDGDAIREIVGLLPLLGEESTAIIRSLLEHKRAVVREAALTTYAMNYPDAGDLPLVLRMLRDDSPAIRKIALALLVQRHPELPQRTVMDLVANPHPDIRLAALDISRRLPPEQASEIIMELILDDDSEVRGRAILEVGIRHLDGWQDILRATLADPDQTIVLAAVDALIRAGTADSVKILENFVRTTKNEALRHAIEGQLESMRRTSRTETL